uniref:Attacin C-terminal domain-containing protein n=1 Tax=Photinus pyralis TaxID=7054 RepID=A0A1Y1LEI5_PHOPY
MLAILRISAVVLLCLGSTTPAAGAVWRHYGASSNGPLHKNDLEMVLGHDFNVGAKATFDPSEDKAVVNQVGVMKFITSHVVGLNATNVSGEGRFSVGGNMPIGKDVTTLLGNGTTVVHYDFKGGATAGQGVDNIVEGGFSSSFITKNSSLTTPTDGTLGRGDKTVNMVISPGANIRHGGVSSTGEPAHHKLATYSQEDAFFSGKVNPKHNNLETSFFSGTTFARPGAANSPDSTHNSPYGQEKAVRIQIGGNVNRKSSDVGATPDNEKAVKLVISGVGNAPKSTSGHTVDHRDGHGIQVPLSGNVHATNLATSLPTGSQKSVNLVLSGGTIISSSASSKGDATVPNLSPYHQEKAIRINIGGNVIAKGNSAMLFESQQNDPASAIDVRSNST